MKNQKKIFSNSRIIILALSIALLIGAVFCISAVAAGEDSTGTFGNISLAHYDKVAIRVEVDATEQEIKDGTVVVSYTINNETKNAEYYMTDDHGRVWVITEGIAIFDLAKEVTFSSTINNVTVEENRIYSIAQFLYKMLYTKADLEDIDRNLYNAILAHGEASQLAHGINTDKLVTDSTLVHTVNKDVALNGKEFAFAPAADMTITPAWNGATPAGAELIGWNILDNGEEKVVDLSFNCSGVVEVVSPIFKELDPTPFILANGGFENGLDGWTLVGNIGGISSATHYWVNDPECAEGFAFGMDGEQMFSAYVDGAYEGAVGTLTSSSFIVGGSGFVTFKLGAMRDGNYVYVDVVDAETKQILARYYNGLWADRTDDVKSGCTLIAYKADLSEFMGKSVFFRISDNADSGYGLFFADSFNTYHVTEPEGFNNATPVDYTVSGSIYDVFNGGFEMGGVQGWWNVGEPGLVTGADAFFSGVAYGKEGNFLYSGVEDHGAGNGREGNRGVLTSSVFQLGGSGYITYMLGGGDNDLCYVQVIDAVTGEVLARYHQQVKEGNAVLKTYAADLSAYVGRTLRVQVVDQAENSWGCLAFDNLVTYHATKPEGIEAVNVKDNLKYTIENGSFETGNKDGWTETITAAGGQNTLGWVLETEIDAGWYAKNDETKDGRYLFTFAQPGDINCENSMGTLQSSTFSLKQGSFVSFRFGGAGGAQNHDVFIELCRADGSVIARFYNDAEGKVNTKMNAYYYQYNGVEVNCFFRVVDNSTGDYGCFVVDDFRVNLDSAPEGFIAAIQ